MRVIQYTKQQDISNRTALRWFLAGTTICFQAATGVIIVQEGERAHQGQKVTLTACVSSVEHRADLERQALCQLQYCEARDCQMRQVIKASASRVNDSRPKLLLLLKDTSITLLVVEYRDRLNRFGFHYLETLLQTQGLSIEVMNAANVSEHGKENVFADLVTMLSSFAARLFWSEASQTQAGTRCGSTGG